MRVMPLFIMLFYALPNWAQLTLLVTSYPEESPVDLEIFVAGNFNSWNPGDYDFKLTDNLDGTFSITFSPAPGSLEFKFTRGSWTTVEGNEFGGYLPNRTFNYTGEATILECEIITWEDLGPGWSTAAENVAVIDELFYMPQLDSYRRIWIYLPPDYETSDESYKVLYMHDGQNVFDLATSFAGEWEVDETLNALFDAGDEGCIVVAIDNGGSERLNEYSPWEIPAYDVDGIGEYYIDFIVETLKPFIDGNYRTKPGREFTGIMGSSMGALISTYGGVEHRETFSRIGAFSPAYWITDSCFIHVEETPHDAPMRVYSIGGALEGASMIENLNSMDATFINAGFSSDEFLTVVHADGQHSEWYWAREFADAYLWLWADVSPVVEMNPTEYLFEIHPNPATDFVKIGYKNFNEIKSITISDIAGRTVYHYNKWQQQIAVQNLPSGLYVAQLQMINGIILKELFIRL